MQLDSNGTFSYVCNKDGFGFQDTASSRNYKPETRNFQEVAMGEPPKIVTGLGKAELHRILDRGRDLTEQLRGTITFRQKTYRMLAHRIPTARQPRKVHALLTILLEHVMVS